MTQTVQQLFSGANTYIHVATYICGDQWWLDSKGNNWWNRKDHFHHDAIYLVNAGSFRLKINGTWHDVHPKQFVYIPADSDLQYDFSGDGPLEKYYVHFDLTFGANHLFDYFQIPSVIPSADFQKAEDIFQQLCRMCADSFAPISQLAANGLLLSLVAELLKQCNAEFIHTPNTLDKEMRESVEYIKSHLGKKLSVSDLAQRVGYSSTYFTKKFKKTFGCTPTDYMANLKISYAKAWLTAGNMSVHAIASALGFCDASYFSNFFKAKTGLYPGYYRKNR